MHFFKGGLHNSNPKQRIKLFKALFSAHTQTKKKEEEEKEKEKVVQCPLKLSLGLAKYKVVLYLLVKSSLVM